MLTKDLETIQSQTGLVYDSINNALVGENKGFSFVVIENNAKACYGVYSWFKEGGYAITENVDTFMSNYVSQGKNCARAYKFTSPNFMGIVEKKESSYLNGANVGNFIDDLALYLSMNYYEPCCAQCKSEGGLSVNFKNGSPALLCDKCKPKAENTAPVAAAVPVAMAAAVAAPQQVIMPTAGTVPTAAPISTPIPAANPVPTYNPIPQATQIQTGRPIEVSSREDIYSNTMPQQPAPVNNVAGVSQYNTVNSVTPAANGYSPAAVPPGFTPVNQNRYGAAAPVAAPLGPVKPLEKPKHFMGFIGAVLFSVLGVIAWVLMGMTGYITWIAGLAMGLSVAFGYKLLGKRIDAAGIIICIIVMLGMGCFAEMLSYSIEICNSYVDEGVDVNILDCLSYFTTFLNMSDEIRDAFLHDLIIGYVITIISSISMLAGMAKKGN